MRVTCPKPSTSSSRRGSVPLKPIETDEKSELPLGLELDPVEPVDRVRVHDFEILAHVAVAAQQHRGAGADGVVERCDRDLSELDVVDPEPLAIRDDRELRWLFVGPTKPVRPLHRQRASVRLQRALVGGPKLLLEVRREGVHAVEERFERRNALGRGLRRSAVDRGNGPERKRG